MRYPPPVDFDRIDRKYPVMGKFIIMFWFFLALASPWLIFLILWPIFKILGIK
jgi:hypothetical protein